MSYTIEDLDTAIEDEEGAWEGSWHEFRYALESGMEYVKVPPGTEGADTYDGVTYEKYQKKTEPGVDIPDIGRAVLVDKLDGRDSNVWFVIRVTDDTGQVRFFRRQGYYDSYGGEDSFDGPTTEVRGTPTTVTVFTPI